MAYNWHTSNSRPGFGAWPGQTAQTMIPQGQNQAYSHMQGPPNMGQGGFSHNTGYPAAQYQGMPQQGIHPQMQMSAQQSHMFQQASGMFPYHANQQMNAVAMPSGAVVSGQMQFQQQHPNTQSGAGRLQEEAKRHQFEEQQRKLKEMSITGGRSRSGSGKTLIDDLMNKANSSLSTPKTTKGSAPTSRATNVFSKPGSSYPQQAQADEDFSSFQSVSFPGTAGGQSFQAPPPGGQQEMGMNQNFSSGLPLEQRQQTQFTPSPSVASMSFQQFPTAKPPSSSQTWSISEFTMAHPYEEEQSSLNAPNLQASQDMRYEQALPGSNSQAVGQGMQATFQSSGSTQLKMEKDLRSSADQSIPVGMPYSSASVKRFQTKPGVGGTQQSLEDDFGDFQSGAAESEASRLPGTSLSYGQPHSSHFPISTVATYTNPVSSNVRQNFSNPLMSQLSHSPPSSAAFGQFRPPDPSFGHGAPTFLVGQPDVISTSDQLGFGGPGLGSVVSPEGNTPLPHDEEKEAAPTETDLYGCELPEWSRDRISLPPIYVKVLERSQDKDGYINIHKLQPILMASGVGKEKLAEIWEMSNKRDPGTLIEEELFLILAMVALAQAGWNKLSVRKLASCRAPPIPELPDYLFMAKGEESVFVEETTSPFAQEDTIANLPFDPSDPYSAFRALDRQRSESMEEGSAGAERRLSMLSSGSAESSPAGKDGVMMNRVSVSSMPRNSFEQEQDDWGTFASFATAPPDTAVPSRVQASSQSSEVLLPQNDSSAQSQLSHSFHPSFPAPLPTSASTAFTGSIPLVPPVVSSAGLTLSTEKGTGSSMKMGSGDDFDDFVSFSTASVSSTTTDSVPIVTPSAFTESQGVSDAASTTGEGWADFAAFVSAPSITDQIGKPIPSHTDTFTMVEPPTRQPVESQKHHQISGGSLDKVQTKLDSLSLFDSGSIAWVSDPVSSTADQSGDFLSSLSVSSPGGQDLGQPFPYPGKITAASSQSLSPFSPQNSKEGSTTLSVSMNGFLPSSSKQYESNVYDFGDFSGFELAHAREGHLNGVTKGNDRLKATSSETAWTTEKTPKDVKVRLETSNSQFDLADRYSALKINFQDGERHATEWKKCLQSVLETFSTAVTTIKRHNIPDAAKREVLESVKGKEHFSGLKEIYAIACRITASINKSALSKSDNDLQSLLVRVFELWAEIRTFMVTSPNFIIPDSLDMSACILAEGEDDAQMCGVCLLNTQKESAHAQKWHLINTNFRYGGKAYHSSCANFWCNKVNSVLPALPPISSGLL